MQAAPLAAAARSRTPEARGACAQIEEGPAGARVSFYGTALDKLSEAAARAAFRAERSG